MFHLRKNNEMGLTFAVIGGTNHKKSGPQAAHVYNQKYCGLLLFRQLDVFEHSFNIFIRA